MLIFLRDFLSKILNQILSTLAFSPNKNGNDMRLDVF